VYSWFIIYRFDSDQVTILRVIHGMRDVKKILKSLK
jgi:plasmid stabilization system protein ParE